MLRRPFCQLPFRPFLSRIPQSGMIDSQLALGGCCNCKFARIRPRGLGADIEGLAMAGEDGVQTMTAQAWKAMWGRPANPLWLKLQACTNFIGDRVTFGLLKGVNLSGGSILDLGCGHARTTMAIMRRFGAHSLTGVDFCEEALESVKRHRGDLAVRTIHSDLMSLDLDEQFDLVFSAYVAEHFWGDLRLPAIQQHARFAKEGGHVLIIVPGPSLLSRAVDAACNAPSGIKQVNFTRAEINDLFTQAGLRVVGSRNLLLGSVLYTLGRKVEPLGQSVST